MPGLVPGIVFRGHFPLLTLPRLDRGILSQPHEKGTRVKPG